MRDPDECPGPFSHTIRRSALITKPVNMRLSEKTMSRVEKIQKKLKTDNRTQAIAYAVRITHDILSTLSKGGKVIIEHKDGTRDRLVLNDL